MGTGRKFFQLVDLNGKLVCALTKQKVQGYRPQTSTGVNELNTYSLYIHVRCLLVAVQ